VAGHVLVIKRQERQVLVRLHRGLLVALEARQTQDQAVAVEQAGLVLPVLEVLAVMAERDL
jgi:hypothetical protein